MAKILYGGGVAEMRGSEAGTTHSRNKGGSYTRQRVTPTNPQSVRQQEVRSGLSELATAWGQTLSQSQRDGWKSFGIAFPTSDVFGAVIPLTGNQVYTRINQRLFDASLARIDDAPANQDVDELLTLTLGADIGAGDFDVTFTPAPLSANDRLQVFCTPGLSPGVSFVKNKLRLISTAAAATASPLDIEAAYVAQYGALPLVGQKVVVECRVLRGTTGAISARLQSSAIVVST